MIFRRNRTEDFYTFKVLFLIESYKSFLEEPNFHSYKSIILTYETHFLRSEL